MLLGRFLGFREGVLDKFKEGGMDTLLETFAPRLYAMLHSKSEAMEFLDCETV